MTTKIHKDYRNGKFEYCYVRSAKELVGTMLPFRPHWEVWYCADGTMEICNSRAECEQWIKEFREIGE